MNLYINQIFLIATVAAGLFLNADSQYLDSILHRSVILYPVLISQVFSQNYSPYNGVINEQNLQTPLNNNRGALRNAVTNSYYNSNNEYYESEYFNNRRNTIPQRRQVSFTSRAASYFENTRRTELPIDRRQVSIRRSTTQNEPEYAVQMEKKNDIHTRIAQDNSRITFPSRLSSYEETEVKNRVNTPIPNPCSPLNRGTPYARQNENVVFSNVSISNFGLRVMINVMKQTQGMNIALSPFSIASILSLVQQGATGMAQTQISSALQMSCTNSSQAFSNFNTLLQRRSGQNILEIASNIFIGDSFVLDNQFKKIAMETFKSAIMPVNFRNPQFAAEVINQWVAGKTHNKIQKLINPDSLAVNTELVLVNAIYFKGIWKTMFNPKATLTRQFRLNNGQIKETPFMRIRNLFKAGADKNSLFQFLIMPFKDEQYSLMILLPLTGQCSVDCIINKLDPVKLSEYHNSNLVDVELEVPRFTVRANIDLNPVLNEMGVKSIFTESNDLYNIGQGYGKRGPIITSAVHSAVLSIDEEGGSAAAATGFSVVALSYDEADIIFKVNRPFLALLWDNQLQLPLFMAKIEDPTL